MESLQHLKQRLAGVKNIGTITKAMELVAATKMRKSQETALASRPYAFVALDLLSTLSHLDGANHSPLLVKRPVAQTAYVLIASDKGLAGSFNSAVVRKFEQALRDENIDPHDARNRFIAIGQKASRYLERRTPNLVHRFTRVGDLMALEEIQPISDFLVDGFLKGRWDEVVVFSTHFRSALRQEVLRRRILPVDPISLKETAREIIPETGRFSEFRTKNGLSLLNGKQTADYLIEPSPEELLNTLAPHLVHMQLYQLILEANASEHAARRVAMKSASDNAGTLSDTLSLHYNKSRQAQITKELTEISAGAEALQ